MARILKSKWCGLPEAVFVAQGCVAQILEAGAAQVSDVGDEASVRIVDRF